MNVQQIHGMHPLPSPEDEQTMERESSDITTAPAIVDPKDDRFAQRLREAYMRTKAINAVAATNRATEVTTTTNAYVVQAPLNIAEAVLPPKCFHDVCHHLALYVIACRDNDAVLRNHIMDGVRKYFRDNDLTAGPYRLDYFYKNTRSLLPPKDNCKKAINAYINQADKSTTAAEDADLGRERSCKMREFLVATAVWRYLTVKDAQDKGAGVFTLGFRPTFQIAAGSDSEVPKSDSKDNSNLNCENNLKDDAISVPIFIDQTSFLTLSPEIRPLSGGSPTKDVPTDDAAFLRLTPYSPAVSDNGSASVSPTSRNFSRPPSIYSESAADYSVTSCSATADDDLDDGAGKDMSQAELIAELEAKLNLSEAMKAVLSKSEPMVRDFVEALKRLEKTRQDPRMEPDEVWHVTRSGEGTA